MTRIKTILDSLRKLRPARVDSIVNGADDDGSGSMGLLEIAEAVMKGGPRPKRSLLFVWHTGEESGLQGSRWFTDHPTVPRDSIVAQINIDMIARGGPNDEKLGWPGYIQAIGTRRLSTELGDLAESVNNEGKHGLVFDYTYDADGHPGQLLLPQRPLHVRPIRHSDRLLQHGRPPGLPPGDRRGAVPRLRQVRAGHVVRGGSRGSGGRSPEPPRGGQAEAGPAGAV